ncbi:MAG: hypothetical protein MI810_06470 [Flavobacteriales bacterium]|nr:hypothetical protein [Flavobacteriales bacterium]
MRRLNEISLKKATARKIDDHILENVVHEGQIIEKNDVIELKDVNLTLAEHSDYALLVCVERLAQITKEARGILATKQMARNNIAKAIVVSSKEQRKIMEIYQMVNKPHHHLKVFDSRCEAMEWLIQQLERNKIPLLKTEDGSCSQN